MIYVLGYDILKEPSKIRKIVSIVPQEGRPLRALTPWESTYIIGYKLEEKIKKEAKEKTEKILRKLELYEAKDRPAMTFRGHETEGPSGNGNGYQHSTTIP